MHTSVENIEMFLNLHFDVAASLDDRSTLGAILAPMIQPDAGTNPRERVWLLAALKLGLPGLKFVMDQKK